MADKFGQNLFNNLMNTWVMPAITERQERGELSKPLQLQMAQIVFKADGSKPIVRINEEVRGLAKVKLSDKFEGGVKAGDPVYMAHIGGIEAFELEEDERDYGHATIISNGENWLVAFNFVYNKNASQNHLSAAREFVHAAKSSFQNDCYRACIDNLHSAAELAGKAYLLGHSDEKLMKAKSHGVVHSRLNRERKLGNLETSHIDTFNILKELQASARYLQKELNIAEIQLDQMITDVEEFVDNADEWSKPKL